MSSRRAVAICRDEECTIVGVHTRSICTAGKLNGPIKITPHGHLIPKSGARPPWKKDDPKGLTGSVARATSQLRPINLLGIYNAVSNDYGGVSERTIYRHVAKLVARGHIAKIDMGRFAVYLRPNSKLLRDPDAIREYVEQNIESDHLTDDASAW